MTTTEEVVAEKEEAQADSEEEAVAEVSDHEKRAVSEVTEVQLQEKVASEAKEVQTDQEENRVLFKEKAAHQDVLKAIPTDRQDARLKRLKTVDREEASIIRISYSNRQLRFALVKRSFLILSY